MIYAHIYIFKKFFMFVGHLLGASSGSFFADDEWPKKYDVESCGAEGLYY